MKQPAQHRSLIAIVLAMASLAQPLIAAPIIVDVVESGGDADGPAPKYTGQTFWLANQRTGAAVNRYYTVPAFGEDAFAYTDRAHNWNGFLSVYGGIMDIPSYLVGGEYIMIANDSNNNPETTSSPPYRLEVTLSQPAHVYVLVDNRYGNGSTNTLPPNISASGNTNLQWLIDAGWSPVTGNGINRSNLVDVPDEVGMDEGGEGIGTGPGQSINQYSTVYRKENVPAGTVAFHQYIGNNMYCIVVQPAGAAADAAPRIEERSPANLALLHPPSSGIAFHARTAPPNSIEPSGIRLIVNGADVSASLAISGSGTDRAVSYAGLAGNTLYTNVQILVTDTAGHGTRDTFSFDTMGAGGVVIENEDYNYGVDAASQPATKFCTTGNIEPPPVASGGGFQDDPPPSGFTPAQVPVHGSGVGYLDTYAVPGVDYFDTTTAIGCTTLSCINSYRACTAVGAATTGDLSRKKYLDLDIAAWDLDLNQVQAGEWLNYTRTFASTNYVIYLRARATAAQTLTLSRVTGNRTQPNQAIQMLGEFQIPATAGYEYIPLRDLGTAAALVLNLSGVQTLRLAAGSAANNVFPNFLVAVPTSEPVTPLGPVVTVQEPAPGAAASIHTPISATIMNRSTLSVMLDSIQLFLDSTNVTASSARAAISGGATIAYQPAPPLAYSSSHSAKVVFSDAGANSYTNEWAFSTLAPMPPTVAISGPAQGAAFASGSSVPITASAQSDAGVARVEYFADRWKIGESTAAPFSFTWTAPDDGRYDLVARAYDVLGNNTASEIVSIVVGADLAPYVLFVGKIDELALTHVNRITDAMVVDHLKTYGLDVQVLDEDIAQTTDADGKQLIVNSSTVTSGDVNTKFQLSPVPFLNWESGLQDDMLMSVAGEFGDVDAQTALTIVDPSHPMAAGLAAGTYTVVTGSPNNWTSGNPGPGGQTIAVLASNPSRGCIYAYEPGALLADGFTPAPARRMHIFFRDTTFSVLNSTGLALFNAAVFYGLGATPPAAGITSPTNGQSFSVGNAVSIAATAAPGSNAIEKVSFYLDGMKIGEDTTSPYAGSWAKATAGVHTLAAVAKDTLGLERTAEVNVNVGDVTPPTVAITSPSANAALASGANVPIAVSVDDNVGVVRVQYLANGESIGESTSAPFGFTWTGAADGRWSLLARAYDAVGNAGDSPSVNILIGQAPPNVLFIVANPTGTSATDASDRAVRDHLAADLGCDVTVVGHTAVQTSHGDGKQLIICSSSVSSGNVGAKFRDTAVPFINWEAGLQDDMAMVAASSDGFDRPSQTDIDIVSPAHPLAAGLAAGVRTVVNSAQGFTAGRPNANAQVIATIAGNASEACIYVYEEGAILANSAPAPALRIHIFLQNTAFANLNDDGLKLFDAAVEYALAPAALGPLTAALADGKVRITWEGPGQLERASELPASSWSILTPTAPNVYETVPTEAKVFYRLRK